MIRNIWVRQCTKFFPLNILSGSVTKSVGKIYIITIKTGIVNVISSKVINTEGFLDEGQEEKDFTDTKIY